MVLILLRNEFQKWLALAYWSVLLSCLMNKENPPGESKSWWNLETFWFYWYCFYSSIWLFLFLVVLEMKTFTPKVNKLQSCWCWFHFCADTVLEYSKTLILWWFLEVFFFSEKKIRWTSFHLTGLMLGPFLWHSFGFSCCHTSIYWILLYFRGWQEWNIYDRQWAFFNIPLRSSIHCGILQNLRW